MGINCFPLQNHLVLVVIHLWIPRLIHPVSLPPLLLGHHVCVTCLHNFCAKYEFVFSNSTSCQCSSCCCWSCFCWCYHHHCCSRHCVPPTCSQKNHKKNSPGEDEVYCGAATTLYSLLCLSTALIDHVYCTHTTTESRFVLSHMHAWIVS